MELVLATRNLDKIKEISAILAPLDVRLRTVAEFDAVPEVVEDGETLEANALKKARVVRDATGCCALADDTGLEVEALNGAPGVYSSRYAGEGVTYDDNNRKLLADMSGVPEKDRSAHFRCVIALALTSEVAGSLARGDQGVLPLDQSDAPGASRVRGDRVRAAEPANPDDQGPLADALLTEGLVHGRIAPARRGTGGFGYDPIFEVERLGRTLAELSAAEKNQISHRYRALVEMRELLLRLGLANECEGDAR